MQPTPSAGVTAPTDAARLIEQVLDYSIVSLDSSGTIESWNAGAARLEGWSALEAVGRSFTLLFTDDERRAGLPLHLIDVARREGRVEHSGWRVRKDGSRFWGDVVISALHHDDGRVAGFAQVTRDLTDHHDLELSLRRSEERFRLLVGEVRDYAIFALDGSGTIESWNTGAERLKGYTPAEALGRSSSIFYTEEDRRAGVPLLLLSRAREEGSVAHTGWRVRKDGTLFWADVVITALRSADGDVTGFAKVTRDLTEHRRNAEASRTFYSSFAHDVLTPVAAVQGFAELLRTGDVDPTDAVGYLQRIEDNADRISAMIRALVDYAAERVSTTPYRPVALTLDDLVEAVIGRLGHGYEVARVRVSTSLLRLHADRDAMERVLTNLVGNALLYSEGGEVTVRIEEHGDRVRVEVRDRGRGIDPRDLPTIFDDFQRGRLAVSDGGSGLGLSSARRLVEQQGGQVTLSSELGVGTQVALVLPAAPPAVAEVARIHVA